MKNILRNKKKKNSSKNYAHEPSPQLNFEKEILPSSGEQ